MKICLGNKELSTTHEEIVIAEDTFCPLCSAMYEISFLKETINDYAKRKTGAK